MKTFLKAVCEGKRLSRAEAEQAMSALLDGEGSPEQIAAFLGGLQARGETVDELVGFATAIRARAVAVPIDGASLLDTCGTGGDNSGTFNISTACAFVLAGGGVGVAKHGNRAASSQSGSADVLEALGHKIEPDPARVAASIRAHHFGFFFAPHFHPVLARVAPVRKALGVRTVFNLIGPLINPARPGYQVLGVFRADLLEPMAEVLRASGAREALVVCAEDGLDELSPAVPTHAAHLKAGQIKKLTLRPEDFGLQPFALAEIKGGLPAENAEIIKGILEGKPGRARDVVILNAAASFVVTGRAKDFRDGARLAAQAIDSGAARAALAAVAGGAPTATMASPSGGRS